MNDEKNYDECGGRKQLVHWKINRHLFYTFEVATAALLPLLPEELEIVEIRPDVSLMSVGVLRYEPNQFRAGSPIFDELVGAIHVAPDLSTKMPVPNMTFLSFSVFSDSTDFVEQEGRTLYTPTLHVPSLEFRFTDDMLGVEVSDDEGPILSCKNSHPDPTYKHSEMWGQHFTNTRGLQHGIWEWDGRVFEHMNPTKNWQLFDHSFWKGISLDNVHRCYRQMYLEPDTVCSERFYEMRVLD